MVLRSKHICGFSDRFCLRKGAPSSFLLWLDLCNLPSSSRSFGNDGILNKAVGITYCVIIDSLWARYY